MSEGISQQDAEPFKEPLVVHEYDALSNNENRLKYFVSNPKLIVRDSYSSIESTIGLEGRDPTELTDAEIADKIKNLLPRFNAQLELLDSTYGVHSSMVGSVIGMSRERNRPTAFIAAKKVEGTAVSRVGARDVANIPVHATTKTAASILAYYYDAFERGGDYLDDLRLSQFVYGHTDDDADDKMYLVDLDPRVSKFEKENPSEAQELNLAQQVRYLSASIIDAVREYERSGVSNIDSLVELQTQAIDLASVIDPPK